MIKFFIIIDTKIDYLSEIEAVLQQQKDTYKNGGVDIVYDVVRQDLSNVPWLTNIVSYSWIGGEAAKLYASGNDSYSVAYVFDWRNWKAQDYSIYGWHMGKYSAYQIQLIKAFKGNPVSNYHSLMMEGMHSWDTPIKDKLGINLSQYLNVVDYDETLVHGMAGQGQVLPQEKAIELFGQEYIPWDYTLLIKRLAPLLNKIFNPMFQLCIFGKEQYIRGIDGKHYHVYNLATLKAFQEAGVVSSDVEEVTSINDSGKDFVVLTQE